MKQLTLDLQPRTETRAERLRRVLAGVPPTVRTAAVYFTDEAAARAERLARDCEMEESR